MEVRRLAWAGLEISAGSQRLVIDLVEDFSRLHGGVTPDGQVPPPPEPGSIHVALLPHLHRDHADPTAIARALQPGTPVLRPERASGQASETALVRHTESELEESSLDMRVVEVWETVEIGPFEITALPAVDGFGDPQVSWSVAAEACRVLHGRDTLFHGLKVRLPRLFIAAGTRSRLIVLGALTLCVGVAMLPAIATMADHGATVIDFESGRTVARSHASLGEWSEAGERAMWWQLALDMPFGVCYGLLFAGSCAAVAARAHRVGKPRLERAR
jgi:hypothetical protein